MARALRTASWVVAACALLLACEKIAHLSSFSVEVAPDASEASGPYSGVCNACPPDAGDLLRPPCPLPGEAPDDGLYRTYVWHTIHLGATPDQWAADAGAPYTVGRDQDCSLRPNGGLPVECTPTALDAAQLPEPWVAIPRGVDNSFSQRILWPIAELAQNIGAPVDLESDINQSFDEGHGSVLVTVFDWNGTPNDSQVSVSLCSTVGVTAGNGPPRWDGTDQWIAYGSGADPEYPGANVPLTDEKTTKAYVSNGVLFADYADLGGAQLTILNTGARVTVILHNFYYTAQITDSALTAATAVGRWYLDDYQRATPDVADYLSGCNALARSVLLEYLPGFGYQAADLAVDPSSGPGAPCDAISTAYQADAVRAQIGGYQPIDSVPGGCPP